MRKALVLLLGVCLLAMFVGNVSARKIDRAGKSIMRDLHEAEALMDIDQGARSLMTSAAVDSYCLVWYDFESMNWQGWITNDQTAQVATFFHVDDFAGLGGGDYGLLVPVGGTKSMWCGTRGAGDARAYADYFYLCSWQEAPGYGQNWDQILQTDAFPITGVVSFGYHGVFDSEPDFDQTFVEYDSGDDNWLELAMYDGTIDTVATHQLLLSQVATKLRFHFIADGAWSDDDGLWNTDGAAIVDDITITDATGLLNSEDWEGEALDVLESDDGFWYARGSDAYGAYVGLSNNLVDKDPCGDNFGTQITFFQGSTFPSADYPGLFDTPFCQGAGGIEAPCQSEALTSPVLDMTRYSTNRDENQDADIPPAALANMGGLVFRFTVYRDLLLSNLVFYTWGIRSIDETGCPSVYSDRNLVYYGEDKDFIQSSFDVSDLYESDQIQFQIGVFDACDQWFDQYGDCAAHTPSPWFDNVRVYTYETDGPQWSARSIDMFQDNFPEEEFNIESFVRIDSSNDLRAGDDPIIDPGDSCVIEVTAPLAGGLDTLATGEERVYCHVWAEYIGVDAAKPDLYGPSLEGTYGSYVSDDGSQWTVFHMPNAQNNNNEVADRYMIDLNDSLFTRGYEIKYYFKAYDLSGASSVYPPDAETGGFILEVTCLPTQNTGMLYVDDFHYRGDNAGIYDGIVQRYWDPAFEAVIPGEMPDRYDVNAPSSLISNGPGAYAYNFHMVNTYEKIVWDSGNLNAGTICEGTDYSDKSNDCQMLIDWMELSEHKTGLWVLGDDVADDLNDAPTASALALMSTYCGVSFVNDSYYELTGGRTAGGVVTPQVTGVSGGIYDGIQYYAFGGCPIINFFDVLETNGTGQYSLQLPDYNSVSYYIGISNSLTNSFGYPIRTSWIGHSLMYVRNGGLQMARNELVNATWEFFENPVNEDITDTKVPAQYALMQNYPNPFNPSTTIKWNMPVKGHVSLKIYNVAGQLVRTLTNQDWDAGQHTIDWNGKNDIGSSVASGVYFYKIEADSFQSTKKMVLLR